VAVVSASANSSHGASPAMKHSTNGTFVTMTSLKPNVKTNQYVAEAAEKPDSGGVFGVRYW